MALSFLSHDENVFYAEDLRNLEIQNLKWDLYDFIEDHPELREYQSKIDHLVTMVGHDPFKRIAILNQLLANDCKSLLNAINLFARKK